MVLGGRRSVLGRCFSRESAAAMGDARWSRDTSEDCSLWKTWAGEEKTSKKGAEKENSNK